MQPRRENLRLGYGWTASVSCLADAWGIDLEHENSPFSVKNIWWGASKAWGHVSDIKLSGGERWRRRTVWKSLSEIRYIIRYKKDAAQMKDFLRKWRSCLRCQGDRVGSWVLSGRLNRRIWIRGRLKIKELFATNHFAHFLHQIIYLKVIIFVNIFKRNVLSYCNFLDNVHLSRMQQRTFTSTV